MQETVGYLDKDDANKLLEYVTNDYILPSKRFKYELSPNYFLIEKSDGNEVKKVLHDDPAWIESLSAHLSDCKCSKPIAAGLLKKIKHLSETYADFKKSEPKQDLIPYMFQDYVDVISSVVKLPVTTRMVIGLIMNSILKNGFFNFVISSDNARIKVLRNMRAHDNLVIDKQTWDANLDFIISPLTEVYSINEIQQLESDILGSKKILLYDMNENKKVNFIMIEEPKAFLKKLITLCQFKCLF